MVISLNVMVIILNKFCLNLIGYYLHISGECEWRCCALCIDCTFSVREIFWCNCDHDLFSVFFQGKMYALQVWQLWEMSLALLWIESEETQNFYIQTIKNSITHYMFGFQYASYLSLSNRSFKQLIGGLENVSNKVYESEEVKAK